MRDNPYWPIEMVVGRIKVESDDRMLRSFDLRFKDPSQRFDFLPGQFCQLSILGKGEAPFGIASSPDEKDFLRFTVNRVGVVTTALHYLKEGEVIGLRGPLGNHYPVEKFRGEDVVIIGGGFAFTTLRSLLLYLLARREEFGQITVIYGARRPGLLLYRDELFQWEGRSDLRLILTVDKEFPGWNRKVGFVPAVTKEVAPSSKKGWAVVCGPPIMIKYTLPVLSELGFPPERIYTSLERRMKCGIGKCGRCNIGPKYVCIDGPVFSLAELERLPEPY
ncbi:heterodisulfide reductase subunit F [candidate division WOR-3 bacterium]|uniref:Heterodisulfide reductase subunit F n=1 Tax=candidate division WOR-3 bacterium TaxID=2052148 RepID=A0A660SKP0_UNCW3|nr:MAG: heterodisulfide reductase subunit F [candidate division WOR-3 bacterium]